MQAKLEADLKAIEINENIQGPGLPESKGQVKVDGPQASGHSMTTVRKLAQKMKTTGTA